MTPNKNVSKSIQFPYSKNDVVLVNYKLAIDYYSALHLAGHKIQLKWNGGNDSGSVWLNVDGVQIDVEWKDDKTLYDRIHHFVIEEMYEVLDYGSWAGDFSANGTADFVIKEDFIGFEGADSYEESDNHTTDFNFSINIPKNLFPAVSSKFAISITGGYDGEEVDVNCRFYDTSTYRSVEISTECQSHLEELSNTLSNTVCELLSKIGGDYVYQDVYFEFTAENDMVETIEELDYYVTSTTDKDVEINLLDLMNEQEY